MKKLIYVIMLPLFLTSCQSSKYIKFSEKENEIFTNQNLKEFLAKNKTPKVVLRIPSTSSQVTDINDNSYLYNAIENELLSKGFIVRDRQLFNQIVTNNENNLDYSVLKDKSDTDLIIELSHLKQDVLHETNKYYDMNNREKVELRDKHRRYGAIVEFKVIIVDKNEYAGIYRFNYTPCSIDPCLLLSAKDQIKLENKRRKSDVIAYEGVESNEMEIFIKNATSKLVNEMRK